MTGPTTLTSTNNRRAMKSFVAFLALFVSQGQAFQPTLLAVSIAANSRSNPQLKAASRSSQADSNNNNPSIQHTPSRQPQRRRRNRNSNTAAYYSNTSDPPPPLSSDPRTAVNSFGARMRNMVLQRERGERESRRLETTDATTSSGSSSSRTSKSNPHKPSFVHEAITLANYKTLVADETEKYVVVRFYAKWCRACKASEQSFYRMAQSMPDVKFVEVPVLESNANLHQGLGVPTLPFGHIYSPTSGLVEELRMAKKEFPKFQTVVTSYRDGACTDIAMDEETGLFLSPFVNGISSSSSSGGYTVTTEEDEYVSLN